MSKDDLGQIPSHSRSEKTKSQPVAGEIYSAWAVLWKVDGAGNHS
jgi:hypothetical protein